MLQPARLRDPEWPERAWPHSPPRSRWSSAFGQILPQAVLDVPARGSINVHASLLPRYRGAAPIAWAIMRGETETGITTFQMDPGMDTGDTLLTRVHGHRRRRDGGRAAGASGRLGARVLLRTLDALDSLARDSAGRAPATLAPRLKKEDGVAPPRGAGARPRQPRAGRQSVAGRRGHDAGGPAPDLARGRGAPRHAARAAGRARSERAGRACIATGEGLLLPVQVQPENRKAMAWEDFLRGARTGRRGARSRRSAA